MIVHVCSTAFHYRVGISHSKWGFPLQNLDYQRAIHQLEWLSVAENRQLPWSNSPTLSHSWMQERVCSIFALTKRGSAIFTLKSGAMEVESWQRRNDVRWLGDLHQPYGCEQGNILKYIYICIYICVSIYICVYIYMCIYICVYIYMFCTLHIYIYIYIIICAVVWGSIYIVEYHVYHDPGWVQFPPYNWHAWSIQGNSVGLTTANLVMEVAILSMNIMFANVGYISCCLSILGTCTGCWNAEKLLISQR